MEFDYGTVAQQEEYANHDAADQMSDDIVRRKQNTATGLLRTRDLFSDGSCAWTEYYTDDAILDKVGRLYGEDYDMLGWYDIKSWQERLEACLKERG